MWDFEDANLEVSLANRAVVPESGAAGEGNPDEPAEGGSISEL